MSDIRGTVQTKYQIIVNQLNADGKVEKQVWDSGKVNSGVSVDIAYAGDDLEARTRYAWTVQVWDGTGNTAVSDTAYFETGLMDEGWSGAQWLGMPDEWNGEKYHYSIAYTFVINQGVFAPVFGASDEGNLYMWQVKADGSSIVPHTCTNNSFSTLTSTSADIQTGIKYDMEIEVNGREVNTYLKEHDGETFTEEHLVASDDLEISPELGRIGFRSYIDGENADVYSVKVTDLDNEENSRSYDFSTLQENPFTGGEVKDGSLHVQMLSTPNNVILEKNADDEEEETLTQYSLEYIFKTDSGTTQFSPVFGAKDENNFVMWQMNNGGIIPHIWTNGSPSSMAALNYPEGLALTSDNTYAMRIEVEGKTVRTYIKTYTLGEDITFTEEDAGDAVQMNSEIPYGQLGFRAYNSEGYNVYLIRAIDESTQTPIIEMDFSNIVENPFTAGEIQNGAYHLTNCTLANNTTLQKNPVEYIVKIPEDTESAEEQAELSTISEENKQAEENPYGLVRPTVDSRGWEFTDCKVPRLRSEFELEKDKIVNARLYTTAAGIYDVYLNGNKVGNDYFNPGNSEYKDRVFYQTFDVTEMLNSGGKNVIGAELGTGWYAGAEYQQIALYYGRDLAFLSKLVVTYENNEETILVSNGDSWQITTDGPLKYANMYHGETYDSNDEMKGWTTTEYKGLEKDGWKNAQATNIKKLKLGEIVSQSFPTIQPEEEVMTAQTAYQIAEDTWIYDFGQNFAGVEKVVLDGMDAGAVIRFRHAEMLNYDESGNVVSIFQGDYGGAQATNLYTANGEAEQSYSPTKSYTGFRYLEITGINHQLPLEDVQAFVLHTEFEVTGAVESSNKNLEQLYKNTTWSTRSNFMSVPTDCPQRDERLGWSFDIGIFARTSTYITDNEAFLRKYLDDLNDCQAADGGYSNIAPRGEEFYFSAGEGGWTETATILTWELYQQFGDYNVLTEYYDNLKRNQEYLMSYFKTGDPSTDKDGGYDEYPLIRTIERAGSWGDWMSLEVCDYLLGDTAYAAYNALLMEKIALVIGNEEDAAVFHENFETLKSGFQAAFFETDNDGNYTGKIKEGTDTQGAYLMAIAFELVPEGKVAQAAENLVKDIEEHNYHLTTGFLGVNLLLPVLSQTGYSDIAYDLLLAEDYPSWLYSVTTGATTMWETWNAYTEENGCQNISFNHYMFGCVFGWVFQNSAGIWFDEVLEPGSTEKAAYKHFIVAPEVDKRSEEHLQAVDTGAGEKVTYLGASIDSAYGRISSKWTTNEDGTITYDITIPANTSATVKLDAKDGYVMTEDDGTGAKNVMTEDIAGIERNSVKEENGVIKMEVGSGTYKFRLMKAEEVPEIDEPSDKPDESETDKPHSSSENKNNLGTDEAVKSVKTGDETSINLWLAFFVVSAGIAGSVLFVVRKRKIKK